MRASGSLRRALFVAACIAAAACSRPQPIVIAPANTTEQKILAEVIAQRLERVGLPIERSSPSSSLATAHQALLTQSADIAIEYSGAAWLGFLHHRTSDEGGGDLQSHLRSEYAPLQLKWFDALGFNSRFVLAVRRADAGRLTLRNITDAERGGPWTLVVTQEFLIRPDGLNTVMASYPGLRWTASPQRTDPARLYAALAAGRADIAAGGATDGAFSGSEFCALQDDRHALPPEDAAIVARFDSLAAHPDMERALAGLSATISQETMHRMNTEVDVRHRQPSDVAAEFLAGLRK